MKQIISAAARILPKAARGFSNSRTSFAPLGTGEKLPYFDPDKVKIAKMPNPLDRELGAAELKRLTGITAIGGGDRDPSAALKPQEFLKAFGKSNDNER